MGEIKNSQAGLCQSPGLPRPSLGSPHQGRPSPTLHATTPAQTPAPSPNRGRAHVQRENEEKSEQTQKQKTKKNEGGWGISVLGSSRRTPSMTDGAMKCAYQSYAPAYTEPAHTPRTPNHARASGALSSTMLRARRVSRSQKTWTTMTVPPAPNRRCCAVKAPTAYYHALLTTVCRWLSCTAYDNAPLTNACTGARRHTDSVDTD